MSCVFWILEIIFDFPISKLVRNYNQILEHKVGGGKLFQVS